MTDFEALIRRLAAADIRFVLVGGFAGIILGSPRTTVDLDIVHARDKENLAVSRLPSKPSSPGCGGLLSICPSCSTRRLWPVA